MLPCHGKVTSPILVSTAIKPLVPRRPTRPVFPLISIWGLERYINSTGVRFHRDDWGIIFTRKELILKAVISYELVSGGPRNDISFWILAEDSISGLRATSFTMGHSPDLEETIEMKLNVRGKLLRELKDLNLSEKISALQNEILNTEEIEF